MDYLLEIVGKLTIVLGLSLAVCLIVKAVCGVIHDARRGRLK